MTPAVRTPDEWLAGLPKPPLEPIDRLTLASDDLLLVCAGFEDRALGALQAGASSGARFDVLMINYLPFVSENKAADILRICREARLSVHEAVYDRERPAGFGATIVDATASCKGRVVVDVSAMSRLLIVQTLVALGSRPQGFVNCALVYCEAEQYPPTEAEAEAQFQKASVDPTFAVLFLSSGVFDVTVVPELASVAPPGAQTRMIAFPSLDAHQLTAIRAGIHPSRFHFVEGDPPSPQNAWRRAAIAKLNQLDDIQNSERSVVSTLDYRENLDLLLRLYGSRPDRERILLCPTGSKMQTVAVAIFRTFVRDVQIVYPTPQSFLAPGQYTLGTGPLHVLDLAPFVPAGEVAA